jgi:hypothetical protein
VGGGWGERGDNLHLVPAGKINRLRRGCDRHACPEISQRCIGLTGEIAGYRVSTREVATFLSGEKRYPTPCVFAKGAAGRRRE